MSSFPCAARRSRSSGRVAATGIATLTAGALWLVAGGLETAFSVNGGAAVRNLVPQTAVGAGVPMGPADAPVEEAGAPAAGAVVAAAAAAGALAAAWGRSAYVPTGRAPTGVPRQAAAVDYWEGEWICADCGYIYNERAYSSKFEDLQVGYKCPQCAAPRRRFARKLGDKIGTTLDGGDGPILIFSAVALLAVLYIAYVALQ